MRSPHRLAPPLSALLLTALLLPGCRAERACQSEDGCFSGERCSAEGICIKTSELPADLGDNAQLDMPGTPDTGRDQAPPVDMPADTPLDQATDLASSDMPPDASPDLGDMPSDSAPDMLTCPFEQYRCDASCCDRPPEGPINIANIGHVNALAIDDHGLPHILTVNSDTSKILYLRWSGSSWISDPLSDGKVGQADTALRFDNQGKLHAVYVNQNGELFHHILTNPNHQPQRVNTDVQRQLLRLVIDSSDNLHLLYRKTDGNNVYSRYHTGQWEMSITLPPTDDFTPANQPNNALVLIDDKPKPLLLWKNNQSLRIYPYLYSLDAPDNPLQTPYLTRPIDDSFEVIERAGTLRSAHFRSQQNTSIRDLELRTWRRLTGPITTQDSIAIQGSTMAPRGLRILPRGDNNWIIAASLGSAGMSKLHLYNNNDPWQTLTRNHAAFYDLDAALGDDKLHIIYTANPGTRQFRYETLSLPPAP